jgi:hypothetical protein
MNNHNYVRTTRIRGAGAVLLLLPLICLPWAFVQGFDPGNNSAGEFFSHTATSSDITSNWTEIDHPLTNDNPDAIVMVAQNWNPGGVGRTYNDFSIGVWYRASTGRWAVFNQDNTSDMTAGAAFNVLIPGSASTAFVHTATSSNITSNWTVIDNPLTNDKPDAIVMVTQNWNPGGVAGIYNDHSIGVWYDGSKWAIFNQDLAAMPEGVAFNVLIPGSASENFTHTAASSNIINNWTVIDHPWANDNPDAFVMVTQNWNPGGAGNTYNDHPVGVWYDGSRWAIFNQDLAAMPEGASFNVSIIKTYTEALVHTATSSNIISNYTLIDYPLTNDNPDAIVMTTQNWNPGGGDGMYNDHPVGVWYSGYYKKWAVFNQDRTAMPEGADFNILIPGPASSAFVHTATSSNIGANWTLIDHPWTNGKPYILVMVTQNWNPGGVGDTYNEHPVGVYYSGDNWRIFNEDLAAMPEGAAFNVLIPGPASNNLVHFAASSNITSNWTVIDDPVSNNNPDAFVMVTHNWNPGGSGGIYNNHPTGVWYDGSKWGIFNQDIAAMPDGAAFNVAIFASPPTLVIGEQVTTPSEFHLAQNYPNPFNATTTIRFTIPKRSAVTLKVYDVLGGDVAILVDETMQPGEYNYQFDARDLPGGLYIYQLKTKEFVESRKFILLK